jgi:hypothetical protein
MVDALEKLAAEAGETLNSYIVIVLDQYLQIQMEQGNLEPPKKEETVAS